MNDKDKKSGSKNVNITLGRVTPTPSNSLKPKLTTKPKAKK
jgi:hypothetical protein